MPLAAASLRAADNTFEPLITQDADTRQGLTEFHSVNGVLNLQLAATYATDDADGPNMPANPVLGDPSQQTIYPRLAFYCQDATHQVTSFAGPLLRVHAGDRVHIQFTNALVTQRTNLHFHGLDVSPLAEDGSGAFGDFVGLPYVNSTAPGDTRVYDFKIPDNELGGPYWYHSHAHGVAEMQVACGLSGAFYVEGAVTALQRSLRERLQPLAASQNHATAASARQTLAEVESTLPQLPHHLLVLKDFWTPGYGPINGPLEQSVNGKITYETGVTGTAAGSPYVIQYGATDQIWDISNQSANLYYVLSFTGSNLGSTGFYLMARDGVPVGANLSFPPLDNALMIPPAGRVTVIVPTGPLNGGSVNVTAQTVNTLGDDYFQVGNQVNQRPAPWNLITMTPAAATAPQGVTPWPQLADALQTELQATKSNWMQNFDASHQVDASYVLAEPPNPSNGYLPPEPAQFSLYRLSDGAHIYPKGPADAYDNYEPPIARLIPDQPQRWIIQNTTGEWHAFHLHQAHFRVERYTVVNDLVNPLNNQDPPADNEGNPFYATNEPPPAGSGQAVGEPFYSGPVDTVSIPDGTQVWLTLPLNEGPQIAGEFVMHCHILEHEDGGMMANVVAGDYQPIAGAVGDKPHLPPLEMARVNLPRPAPMIDASGKDVTSDLFRKNDYSLVTFGYTTCQGACTDTLERCVAALRGLHPEDASRISPFFVSLDVDRDNAAKLRDYARIHALPASWGELLDSHLAASRAFGAQRKVLHKTDGSIYLVHSTTIYLIDRDLKIRAAFDQEDSARQISKRITRELDGPATLLPAAAGKS